MVVLEATVDRQQVERELEQIEDQEVGVDAEVTGGAGEQEQGEQTQILGNMARRLTLILGALGVLLQLDTVVEILNGLFRMLEVAFLPIIALLNAFLRPIMERLLRLIGSVDFTDLFGQLERFVDNVLTEIGQRFENFVQDVWPTGETSPRETARQTAGQAGDTLVETTTPIPSGGLDMFRMLGTEFSNSGLQEFLSEKSSDIPLQNLPGVSE